MYYEELKSWVKNTSIEEMKEFFSAFTKDEIREDDLFKAINVIDCEVNSTDFVYRYFYFRDSVIEQKSNDEVEVYLKEIISKNQKVWEDYVKGKDGASGRFIGGLVGQYKVPADKAKETVEKLRGIK